MLTDEIDIFTCEPHNDLLSNRSWNEAYCTANPGVEYAVFFPDGGNVLLDVTATGGQAALPPLARHPPESLVATKDVQRMTPVCCSWYRPQKKGIGSRWYR